MDDGARRFLVLGNQLFAIERLAADRSARFLMVEDEGFCRGARHHKLRLTMVLAQLVTRAWTSVQQLAFPDAAQLRA